MQINGLKFFQDKGWKPASTYQSDDGKIYPIAANQKIVCVDESNDIVNITLEAETPLSFKPNEQMKPVILLGNVSHTAFGWTLKGKLA